MDNMFYDRLRTAWKKNDSFVCVGLDSDKERIPRVCMQNRYPIFEFNKAIVDATYDCVCAYKPQIAYYSAYGAEDQLLLTMEYIKKHHPEILVILDAKRADIGATSMLYAKEAFERYHADAVTVNPYLGFDSIEPFLTRKDKGVFVLCKTSNPGSKDFQDLRIEGGEPLYGRVCRTVSQEWNHNNNVALVVGATYTQELAHIRALCPVIPLLVPGIGSQGGDVEQTMAKGIGADGYGLIINSSRSVLYASPGDDFALKAREKAQQLRDAINRCRKMRS